MMTRSSLTAAFRSSRSKVPKANPSQARGLLCPAVPGVQFSKCMVSSGVSEGDKRRQLHHDDNSALTGRRTDGTLTAAGNHVDDLMDSLRSSTID